MNPRGVVISVISSASFAVFTFLAALAAPLDGVQVWAWRIIMTVPGILFALAITGRWVWFTGEARRVIQRPIKLLAYAFTAPMLAFQMWLFGWAPQTGHALDVSLGYFLMPLAMVLVGRFVFHEKMTPLSAVAAGIAGLAVAHEVWRTGHIGWPTWAVAIGYPAYFVVRRFFKTDGVGALTWEMALAAPIAFAVAGSSIPVAFRSVSATAILLILGAISIVGTVTYVVAAKKLSYTIFGLLSYLEPVLVTLVAIAIGERIDAHQWPTFIGIWLAVLVLALDGIRAFLSNHKFVLPAARPWHRRRSRRANRKRKG